MRKSADENQNHYAHAPLPYVVVLRAALGEDGPVERYEQHVLAYSLYEAMFTAVVEATGQMPESTKYTIESIRPDVKAYLTSLVNRLRGTTP